MSSPQFPPLDVRPSGFRYDDPPLGCEVLVPECDVVLLCRTAGEFFVIVTLPDGDRDITPQLSSFVAFGLAHMRAAVGGDGASTDGNHQEEVGKVRMVGSHPQDRFFLVDLNTRNVVCLTEMEVVRAVASACSTLLQRPTPDLDEPSRDAGEG